MEVADITDAVENPLQLLERDLQKSNVEIVRKFYEVPPVLCDIGQLSQVCLNLITNARDAMLPDGGTLTVVVKQDEDEAVMAFSDTGSGVPSYVMENLFQPFVTTKGPLGGGEMVGSGLGLSVSYGIVKSHGGTIDVETRPGRGSTFTVRLPIQGAKTTSGR